MIPPAAALEVLRRTVDELGGSVAVATRTPLLGLAVRRWLARHGTLGTAVGTLPQLVEPLVIAELVRDGRRPLTDRVRRLVIRQALSRTSPDLPAALATHPDTLTAVDRILRRVRHASGADPDRARRLLGRLAAAGPVGRLVAAVWDPVRGVGFDDVDVLATAAQLAPDLDLPPLVVYLPGALDTATVELLRAWAARAPVHLLCARFADLPVPADPALAQLGVLLDTAGERRAPDQRRSYHDPDQEAWAVAAWVEELGAAGVPLEEVVVLHPGGVYGSLLHAHLEAAAIPHNGPSERSLAQTLPGRFLRGLLDLATDGELHREDVLTWIASVPFRVDDRPAPVAVWRQGCAEAQVIAGSHWEERLRPYATRRENGWVRAALEALCDTVARLRDLAQGPRRWAEWAAELRGWLDRHLPRQPAPSWPDSDAAALVAVRELVDGLGGLDAIGAQPAGITEVHDQLATELAASAAPVGRYGTGVHLAPVGRAGGLPCRHLWVCGAADGLLPPAGEPDPVLEAVRPGSEDPLLDALLDPDPTPTLRYDLEVVLATATEAVVSRPRTDPVGGVTLYPSPWLWAPEDTTTDHPSLAALLPSAAVSPGRLLAAVLPEGATPDEPLLDRCAAVVAASRGGPSPGEGERGSDLDAAGSSGSSGGRPPTADPVWPLRRMLHAVHARRSSDPTPYDGIVGPHPAIADRLADGMRTTELEVYATCGRRSFLDRILGVRAVEDPYFAPDLSGRDRGSWIHTIVAALLEPWVADPARPWPPSAEDQRWMREELDRQLDRLAADHPTGPLWPLTRIDVRRDLEQWIARQRTQPRPVAVEWEFGPGRVGSAVVRRAGDLTLTLRGRIDRIDRDRGALTVVDLKTGTQLPKVSVAAPFGEEGATLQGAVYALAAEAHWRERVRFGYEALDGTRKDPVPLDEVRVQVEARLDGLVRSLADGVFPAVPGAWDDFKVGFAHCRTCPFDLVCLPSLERERRWEHIAPALPDYVWRPDPTEEPDREELG